MSKHTPEPWGIWTRPDADSLMITDNRYARHLAYMVGDGPEDEANAHRIVACVNGCEGIANPSAVKDLLEAAEAIVGEWEAERLEWVENRDLFGLITIGHPETGGPMFDRLRDAITKAKGGS